jgi:hypothetical protein
MSNDQPGPLRLGASPALLRKMHAYWQAGIAADNDPAMPTAEQRMLAQQVRQLLERGRA